MSSEKLSKDDFVLQGIKNLRKGNYKGIHAVYSGFNTAFRDYFGEDPRPHLDKMRDEGKIEIRLRRGGPMLYLPGDAPLKEEEIADTIAKITGE